MRIDSHQHFWKYSPLRDTWITDDMAVIQKDFLPVDLEPILKKHGFDGCVTVQSDQSSAENKFQLKNAEDCSFIKGVVGWVDLRAADITEQLAELNKHPKLKGFRHVLQGDSDRASMLKPEFVRGIHALSQFKFTYDILIYEDQLSFAEQLVRTFPNQLFVLDHLAKPNIKNKKIKEWEKSIRQIAETENLYCKVSGMVTEADWQNWKPADFIPYLDIVFDAFGVDRLMYGSDWPVCQVAGGYDSVYLRVYEYARTLSTLEQDKFFGLNAVKFYNL